MRGRCLTSDRCVRACVRVCEGNIHCAGGKIEYSNMANLGEVIYPKAQSTTYYQDDKSIKQGGLRAQKLKMRREF